MKSQRRRYPWQTTATRRHWLPPYRPWFSYLSSLAMVLALAASLLRNRTMTGNLLEISPFNIMLGPSTEALIQTGARYLPCLYGMQEHSEQAYICPDQIDQGQTGPSIPSWRLAVTNQTTAATCNLQDVCGSGTSTAQQAYRFFTAPFLHAGILHCFLVFTVQLGLGRRVERQLGPLRYGFVWLVCAFFSYLVSAVFSPTQTATMGASGALFGIVALLYVDLLTHWWRIPEAAWEFCKLLTLTVIGLISGYLPGLDNFVHIGGFVAGILLGLVVMLDMSPRRRQETTTVAARLARWAFRIVVIALFAVACGLTLNAFYQGKQEVCSVCMYLACLPVGNMCQAAGVALP
ncbi:rhomboid family-domain-containing protein [Syncephalastrum racemosum]|uniref:Rhomboid-type serine protease n=1 Tax=Syncephalastrum racemosum TaxID=13706 RepID=A0A1X2H4A0_SYNRA|nr:rhomboid family-domain-containing protein [Syncephalastrum racemosum]